MARQAGKLEMAACAYNVTTFNIALLSLFAAGEARPSQNGHCLRKCGDKDIPYPFGVGDGCFLNQYFSLTCYNYKLYFDSSNIEVLNISLDGHMDISMYVSQICYNESAQVVEDLDHSISSLTITAFPISSSANKFLSVGCDSYGYSNSFQDEQSYSTGCLSRCNQLLTQEQNAGETCSGIGCCQIDIPPRMRNITFQSFSFNGHKNVWRFNNCSYAFVAKQGSFNFSPHYLEHLPFNMSTLVLDWSIVDPQIPDLGTCREASNSTCSSNAFCQNSISGFGFRCFCQPGFQAGNPYIYPDGYVNECDDPKSNNCSISVHAQCPNSMAVTTVLVRLVFV
ncbi:wall-associated receptor kinase 2-like [Prosopis cineraria]|uniref:wall-associated receptor kinase 2-like n=1 Tax=Prosopis cineraria TaxID=364024 RepID=UPI0024108E6D|nr:wall-associated receptor kinase 2-like [Prosopis cineraria]